MYESITWSHGQCIDQLSFSLLQVHQCRPSLRINSWMASPFWASSRVRSSAKPYQTAHKVVQGVEFQSIRWNPANLVHFVEDGNDVSSLVDHQSTCLTTTSRIQRSGGQPNHLNHPRLDPYGRFVSTVGGLLKLLAGSDAWNQVAV